MPTQPPTRCTPPRALEQPLELLCRQECGLWHNPNSNAYLYFRKHPQLRTLCILLQLQAQIQPTQPPTRSTIQPMQPPTRSISPRALELPLEPRCRFLIRMLSSHSPYSDADVDNRQHHGTVLLAVMHHSPRSNAGVDNRNHPELRTLWILLQTQTQMQPPTRCTSPLAETETETGLSSFSLSLSLSLFFLPCDNGGEPVTPRG